MKTRHLGRRPLGSGVRGVVGWEALGGRTVRCEYVICACERERELEWSLQLRRLGIAVRRRCGRRRVLRGARRAR